MPTPTGTISMSDVNTELGKSSTAQISLNDTNVRTLAGVASGTISMDNLRGKSNATVAISNQSAQNLSKSGIGGGATATYRLNSNGIAYATNVNGSLVSISGEWLLSGSASAYEAYMSIAGGGSGGSTGGTFNTWVNLGTTRDWTLSATNNYAERYFNLQIRLASTGAVLDTATITFIVDSAP